MKRVEVFSREQYDEPWPPEGLAEFREWVDDLLEGIPEEFRDSAKIQIDSTTSYGQSLATVTVSYVRPETDEEAARREHEERAGWEQQRNRLRHELEQIGRMNPARK
jgi:hypothetical protein